MNLDNFEELQGGLKVGVISRQQSSALDRALLDKALFTILDHEARAHHTEQGAASRNAKLLKALDAGKIEAWFMVAAWDVATPKILGAAIELPTVLISEVDGKLTFTHAKYREDTCFRTNVLRELLKEQPTGTTLPDVGLCDYFEQERMRIMTTNDPTGKVQGGRIGEYSAHSAQMIKVMNKMGATLGSINEPIMEIAGDAPLAFKHWPVNVDTLTLNDEVNGRPLNYVFATSWQSQDGKQQVVATFTEAISTFTGEPVVRVQFGSLGTMPDAALLKDITASLLAAGQNEIERRDWKRDDNNTSPFASAPIMRIHAPKETAIISALKDIEAQVRSLGPHPMLPAIMNFADLPGQVTALKSAPSRPVSIIEPVANMAYFDLAA